MRPFLRAGRSLSSRDTARRGLLRLAAVGHMCSARLRPTDPPSDRSTYDCAPRQNPNNRFDIHAAPPSMRHGYAYAPDRHSIVRVTRLLKFQARPVVTDTPSPIRAKAFPQPISPRADRLPVSSSPVVAFRSLPPSANSLRFSPCANHTGRPRRGRDSLRSSSAPRPLSPGMEFRAFFLARTGQASDHPGSRSKNTRTPTATATARSGNSGDLPDPASRWPHRT